MHYFNKLLYYVCNLAIHHKNNLQFSPKRVKLRRIFHLTGRFYVTIWGNDGKIY